MRWIVLAGLLLSWGCADSSPPIPPPAAPPKELPKETPPPAGKAPVME